MTEEQAKTKWCPFTRVAGAHIADRGNRWPEDRRGDDQITLLLPASRCIGSACMAWRWGVKRNPDWKPDHGMMSYSPRHPDDGPHTHIKDNEHGYCGLAGRQ